MRRMCTIFVLLLFTTLSYSQTNLIHPAGYHIKLAVNYPASLLVIIDDLSQWSEFSEPRTLEFWQKTFSVSEEQKALLTKYAEVRKKYKWGYFEPHFFAGGTIEEALAQLNDKLEPGERAIVKNTLYAFKKDFDSLWKDNYLLERKKKLEGELARINISELLTNVARFYNAESPAKEFEINLLFSPFNKNSDGGANGGIYIRNGKDIPVDEDLMVIFHEIAHTFGDAFKAALFNIAEQEGIVKNSDKNILQEAVNYSLFPAYFFNAYLGKNFDLKEKSDFMKGKNRYMYLVFGLAGDIYPLAVNAIKNGTGFNREAISKVVELYKQNWITK